MAAGHSGAARPEVKKQRHTRPSRLSHTLVGRVQGELGGPWQRIRSRRRRKRKTLTRLAIQKQSSKDKDSKVAPRKQPSPEEMDTLKLKKAWEVALAPVKSLPMTAIMMYMSGNSLQIFSIMMVFMAFKNPVVGLMSTAQAFERFESDGNRAQMLQVKLAYVAMQLLALAVGVWKVNAMGLLPYVNNRSQRLTGTRRRRSRHTSHNTC